MSEKKFMKNINQAELVKLNLPLHVNFKFKRLTPKQAGLKASIINYHEFDVEGYSKIHYHENMEHIMYVLKGEGNVIIGDNNLPIKSGDIIALPINVPHGIKNTGDKVLSYLMFSNTAIKEKMSDSGSIAGIPIDKS
jgi:quercetin dioxygenase-like cupin family protein